MKYQIIKVNEFYFIRRMSDSMARHWDIMVEYGFKTKEEAVEFLAFYKETYHSSNYETRFTVVHEE